MTKARTLADNYAADINQVSAGIGITGGGTSGTVTITNDMATTIAAKGDLVAGTANDAYAALTVGANNTVLTADSSTATGLKWATASAGANWSLLNAGGTALTGATAITVSGISGVDKIMILVQSASSANALSEIRIRLNADTGSNYAEFGAHFQWSSAYDAGNYTGKSSLSENSIFLARMSNIASSFGRGAVTLTGCNSAGVKAYASVGAGTPTGSNAHETVILQGYYNSSSTISSISVVSSTGNFDAGTVYVYTSA